MKKKFIDYYMAIADVTAKLSYAKRLQIGAVLVRDNQIIATGYNGMPAGWENDCEVKEWFTEPGWWATEKVVEQWPFEGTYFDASGKEIKGRYKLVTKPDVIHAEFNAIAKVAKSTENSDGSTLFCTHSPCIDCAKLIYQSGITTVYYREIYRNSYGIEFLKQGGVDVHQYSV